MKPFPLPVVPMVGPGSQPVEEILNFLASPGEMAVFRAPVPRAAASPEVLAEARRLLEAWVERMAATPFGSQPPLSQSLLGLEQEVVNEVNELMGQGEVSVLVAGAHPLHIQETAFAGVWRVQELREDGGMARDDLEAGSIPAAVAQLIAARPVALPAPIAPPPGVMNAPALLSELSAQSAARVAAQAPGRAAHVINLTLLPVTPEDLAWLDARLGRGVISILSRGYGNCRITATALPHTWWVQYFNSMDQLILNTLEVVEVPEVALAAREDYEDSIERMREWVATLAEV